MADFESSANPGVSIATDLAEAVRGPLGYETLLGADADGAYGDVTLRFEAIEADIVAVTETADGAAGGLINEAIARQGADDSITASLDAFIEKETLDANSVMVAIADNTPVALAMGASTFLARLASGDIVAATPAQVRTLLAIPEVWPIAITDETTAITAGTNKFEWRAPFAMTVTAVRASLKTASSSGVVTVDINEGGTSILGTKLTIDANEKTSTTAAAAATLADTAIADDAILTFDIDTAGTGAVALKVAIYGVRA